MCRRTWRNIVTALSLLAFVFSYAATAQARIEAEAIPGAPFGVGRVTVPLLVADAEVLETRGYMLYEENGRALYPVFTTGAVQRLLGELIGGGESDFATSLTAYFLFTGDEPLKITLVTSRPYEVTVRPEERRPRDFTRLSRNWWREYNSAVRQQAADGDYPPVVETYLTSMLGNRLGFEPPLLSRLGGTDSDELTRTMELLFGVEELRAATMRETMSGRGGFDQSADRPVPRDIAWGPAPAPPAADDVDIEAIAMHVPEECFYVRFGNFGNYLWLTRLTNDYGGELTQMINLRGHDARIDARQEKQLALKQTFIGDLLGGTVIADVAMIGRDMFMREGAAVGILFEAKNEILAGDIVNQRTEALEFEKENGATLETLKIAGHDVTFLSTPDNRLRSFHAIDGNFNLVTTSRAMVERFYQAGEGKGALGASAEFRHARTLMPTGRKDTVFAYLSTAFLRGLISPQYQIELARRIQSVTDMELLQMAQLAARAEGLPDDTIDDLVAAGLLPRGFGTRPDGSGPVVRDGRLVDSLRGGRGSFVPVTDVPLRGVTAEEEARYAVRAEYYQEQWRQFDPLMVGIRRFALPEKNRERLVIDANISPYGEEKYGWITSLLGPPTRERITPAPGDIINIQASVKGGLFSPTVPPHYLFARVQDVAPPATGLKPAGLFKTLRIFQTTPGYLGAWPKPGFLEMLPFRLGSEPDPHGFSTLPFGLWRWEGGGFSLFSFDQPLLAHVAPHLLPVEADDPAQVRVTVGDLSTSKLAPWISSMNYSRAVQTSLGNVRMLHALSQQFHVPIAESREIAEQLLDVKLACALGGEYQVAEHPNGVTCWTSNKCNDGDWYELPEGYSAPLLEWFRGVDASLTKSGDRMILHAQLDMQRKESEIGIKLPSFNLFGPKKPEPKEELLPAPSDQPEAQPGPRKF